MKTYSKHAAPRRRLGLLAAGIFTTVLLASCASTPGVPKTPRLVVFMAVDGLPMRQVTGYRDQLGPDGFARFLDRGAWFANAHYGYSFTVTGAGHATMLTGAYPHRTGIIGNDWRDQATGAPVYCAGDTQASYIGNKTEPLDGTSPRNLKVETVGDVLRASNPASKVIAISGKDRGSILPAGHKGVAYMYQSGSGQFASTTYYMKEHPAWVTAFNAAKPADRYFRQQWKPLLPDAAYARSLPDNQRWYVRGGALPMDMNSRDDDAPGPRFYGALLRSPFADELSLEFARAAIRGESLGQDDAPDILSVSLSGHDYVNHAFSAESRLSHDHLLQLDRMLQAFFRDLDRMVGADNYVVVMTADHGFMPAPEYTQSQGQPSGKVESRRLLARVNEALEKRFGPGRWAEFSGSTVLLNRGLLAQTGRNLDELAEEARQVMVADPGIAAAYTRRELLSGSRASEPMFAQMRKSWHPQVSGDVQFAVQRNWMFASSSAATHGSPHDYDTHVPILFYGPAFVKAARIDERVETADMAPTIARMLGIAAPAAAEGRPLVLPRP